ncbi:hypothetical protein D9V86_06505 [Bacteroidetes/Chlorobi group bacterium ChocPot_Mid]|nr:MAG: hypothetical protein D9V86_06505 [Bacteroidetes/Chlorobi group bacterium ChocPot_Mid]
MTQAEFLAKIDNQLRPFILLINPWLATLTYSYGRKLFLKLLSSEIPKTKFEPPSELHRKFWDIQFQLPLFNAAGMFKNAEGYFTVASQGAGAYLAGTVTYRKRKGNFKNGILHPFLPYHSSGSASNWMGLPNEGFDIIAKRLSKIEKVKGCPVGISLSFSPDAEMNTAIKEMLEGMEMFEKANVDFIELNESCPNVKHAEHENQEKNLWLRMEQISEKFLAKRKRNLPVIVKFSNDTTSEQIPNLIDNLINFGFDGINFGNTSTEYPNYLEDIDRYDIKNFQYFTNTYKGGLSGKILKQKSLDLCTTAVNQVKNKNFRKEFHIIRTGGVETIDDIKASNSNSILINQWFTGYFSAFSMYGHKLYEKMFSSSEITEKKYYIQIKKIT